MQSTADFHEQITGARLQPAAGVVNNATAFDAAGDMLNMHAAAGDAPIRGFLSARQGSSSRFSGRHDGFLLVQGNAMKPSSGSNQLPAGKGYGVASAIRLS